MTEQERRRRRRERERRMRSRMEEQKRGKKRGLTAFRVYVTTILVGGCMLISLFHTETSEMVCEKVKEVIAVQVSSEEVAEWKGRLDAYLKEKEFVLPVFEEKEQGEKKTYRPDTEP